MAEGFEGWAELGSVLAGDSGNPDVYQDTLKKTYSTAGQLEDAKKKRAARMIQEAMLGARDAFNPEVMASFASGSPEAQAQVMAAVLGSAQTPNMRNLGDYSRAGYGDMTNLANEAGVAGDIPAANRFNALAIGEEYQPTIELGGAYINNGADVVAGAPFVPTLGTLGDIERDEAAAQASLIRANKPPAPRRETTASGEAEVLAQAREKIAGGADPVAVAEYLTRKGYPGVAKKIAAPIK